ncbi:unnamed protein product [Caretta caretta]
MATGVGRRVQAQGSGSFSFLSTGEAAGQTLAASVSLSLHHKSNFDLYSYHLYNLQALQYSLKRSGRM